MLKILSLFSGIGAFEKALTNIGEPYEVVNYCEIDKYASKAYSLIHNLDENMNLGDITKVDTSKLPNDIDFVTYGFPCQDISVAGKGEGFTNANGELTRSGLFFQALRIIEDTQPKIAIAENVKALTGKRFKVEFKIVLDSLNDAGYVNYWAVLNGKDYGIPQNRERVFIISIRKDIAHGFKFPEKYELKLRLKDLLEDSVDEKYYLSEETIKNLITSNIVTSSNKLNSPCVKQIGNCLPTKTRENPNQGCVYDVNGLSPTINAMEGGNRQPFIVASRGRNPNNPSDRTKGVETEQRLEPNKQGLCNTLTTVLKDNYVVEPFVLDEQNGYIRKDGCVGTIMCDGSSPKHNNRIVGLVCINSKGGRGGVDGLQPSLQNRVYDSNAISAAVTTSFMHSFTYGLRIRRLTPKECFRLMGFDDTDFEKIKQPLNDTFYKGKDKSDTQLYKMAGNSIIVDVLEEIFVEILNQYEDVFPYCGVI